MRNSRNNYQLGKRRKRRMTKQGLVLLIFLLVLTIAIILVVRSCSGEKLPGKQARDPKNSMSLEETSPTPEPTPTPTPTPPPVIPTDETLPSALGVQTKIEVNGSSVSEYKRASEIIFEDNNYAKNDGILTFRGSNYRDLTSFGTAKITEKTLSVKWNVPTSSIKKNEGTGYWTGAGWTGQPLIVKWPESTIQNMNINDGKKQKKGLVEVVYAIEDGRVYFIDLEDGELTRKTLNMGITFKGSGSLDPRGYPILYVGAGDMTPKTDSAKAKPQEYFVISLLDTKQIYSFGKNPDSFSKRKWHAYDAASLIHAGTDTLIEPGENGILYTIKLNTKYDEAAGTLSIDPDEVAKMRYSTSKSRKGEENNTYWVGMETSPVAWQNYLYVADNCGTLLCIDLNTLKVVWAQSVQDDTNGSPVLELEDGHPYLYQSTSLHWTKDSNSKGTIPVWKIDALSGEKVWQKDFSCYTVPDVSGGVQSTALLGKNGLKDLVYFSIARTPDKGNGLLVAFSKKDGEIVWQKPMSRYAWSSPVAIYDETGKGYVVQCDSGGNMFLHDGLTGDVLSSVQLGEQTIEATPSVYGNMIVVGSRGQMIYGVEIK